MEFEIPHSLTEQIWSKSDYVADAQEEMDKDAVMAMGSRREAEWKVFQQGQAQVSAAAAERWGDPGRLPGGSAVGV